MSNSTEDMKKNMIGIIRPLIEGMPQPEAENRLAAFFHVVSEAAGIDKKQTMRAFAMFATGLHQEYAEVLIHHRDGSIESFVNDDFRFDIRPGSPYYKGNREQSD